MTNVVWRDYSRAGSETNSDETVVIFNLNRLNKGCPEWVRRDTWGRGQILEDLKPLIEALVQRVDRDRFRLEVGGPRDGPQIHRLQTLG
nr:hypothetical protein CFP56_22974 [Quercus suber]